MLFIINYLSGVTKPLRLIIYTFFCRFLCCDLRLVLPYLGNYLSYLNTSKLYNGAKIRLKLHLNITRYLHWLPIFNTRLWKYQFKCESKTDLVILWNILSYDLSYFIWSFILHMRDTIRIMHSTIPVDMSTSSVSKNVMTNYIKFQLWCDALRTKECKSNV